MINITADKNENVLIVKFAGIITPEDIELNLKKFNETVSILNDGFCIINDLSTLSDIEETQLNLLNEINKKINSLYKIKRVIRIISKSKHLLLRLSKMDTKYRVDNISYVPNMKAALEVVSLKENNN